MTAFVQAFQLSAANIVTFGLNPFDASVSLALSNANLTVTSGVAAVPAGVRSQRCLDRGVVGNAYFEVTLNVPSNNISLGVCNDLFNLAEPFGVGSELADRSGLCYASTGYVPCGVFKPGQLVSATHDVASSYVVSSGVTSNRAGDVIGFAINNSALWVTSSAMQRDGNGWNNQPLVASNPAGFGVGGYPLKSLNPGPLYAVFNTRDVGSSVTFNFGDTPFHFPIPAGFVGFNTVAVAGNIGNPAIPAPVGLNCATIATDVLIPLSWQPVAAAASYNVQQAGFGDIHWVSSNVAITAKDVTVPRNASPGTYFFRVQAVDSQGRTGVWSSVRLFPSEKSPFDPNSPLLFMSINARQLSSTGLLVDKVATPVDPSGSAQFPSYWQGIYEPYGPATAFQFQNDNIAHPPVFNFNGFDTVNDHRPPGGVTGGGVILFGDPSFTMTGLQPNVQYALWTLAYLSEGNNQPALYLGGSAGPFWLSLPGTDGFTGGLNAPLVPPGAQLINWSGTGLVMTPVGVSPHFAVHYDPNILDAVTGQATCQAILAGVEAIYDQMITWFGPRSVLPNPSAPKRLWYENPGQDGSFWVTPFADTAQFDMTSAVRQALICGAHGVVPHGVCNFGSTGFAHAPWVIGRDGDPVITIANTSSGNGIFARVPLGTTVWGPGPKGPLGGADSTQPYVIWSVGGDGAISNPDANGGVTKNSIITCSFNFSVDNGAGQIMMDAVTGQPGANNTLGSAIQEFELLHALADPNYVIQHMLCYLLDPTQCNTQVIWPLLVFDQGASNTGIVPQGYTIGIPKDTPRPVGRSRGFYLLFDQLQQYGWFFYNKAEAGFLSMTCYSASAQTLPLAQDVANNLDSVLGLCGILTNQFGLSSLKGMAAGGKAAFPPPPILDLSPTQGLEVLPATFNAWQPSQYPPLGSNGTGYNVLPSAPIQLSSLPPPNITPSIRTAINPTGGLINVFVTAGQPFAAGHAGCSNADIVISPQTAADLANTDYLLLLVAAELSEVFMPNLGSLPDCDQHALGEGLSLAMASELFPVASVSNTTSSPLAAYFMNGVDLPVGATLRGDFVNVNPQGETINNYDAIGCAALFCTYLVHQLNFTFTQICAALLTLPAFATCGQLYQTLNQSQDDPYPAFITLLNTNYPIGTIVPNNFPVNPWPLN